MTYQWEDLQGELNLWRDGGLSATFWWRDDDATADSPALRQLLEMTGRAGVPVALATIPQRVREELPEIVQSHGNACVLQHGYSHNNYAPARHKKAELGDHRELDVMLAELGAGHRRLSDQFGARFTPVLVPPWNRYSPRLPPLLQRVGLIGISAMWARTLHSAAPLQVNAHIDPIAWRDDRGFAGLPLVLEQLISHLRLRREVARYRDEPTGLLTHHLDHTPAVWDFCQQLIDQLAASEQVRWVSAPEIWALSR